MKRRLLLAGGLALLPAARGQALREQPGAALPLELPFTDSAGRGLRLADCFDGRRSVLLVPGYYRCPQLCGLVMHALLQALWQGGVDRDSYRIVRVSIAPEETVADARLQRERDTGFAATLWAVRSGAAHPTEGAEAAQAAEARVCEELRVLVGDARPLLARIGFDYRRLDDGRYEHPAAVVVATPAGRVARYLPGLDFDPGELRIALAEAAGGRIAGLSERLALLCGHLDPRTGLHTPAVLNGLRVAGVGGAAALGAWCWRRRHGSTADERASISGVQAAAPRLRRLDRSAAEECASTTAVGTAAACARGAGDGALDQRADLPARNPEAAP